jgi:CheY-like chemotaxis protein
MPTITPRNRLGVCRSGVDTRHQAYRTADDLSAIALDGLRDGHGVMRSSILLFDADGVIELIECVRRLRPPLPAGAVSAYARPEDRDRALASGYRAYCTEPVDHRQLLQTVRHVLTPTQPSRSTLAVES